MKRWLTFTGVMLFSLLLSQCGGDTQPSPVTPSAAGPKKPKIGLVPAVGNFGDNSFYDKQYTGLIEASRQFGVEVAYKVPGKPYKTGGGIPKEEHLATYIQAIKQTMLELVQREKCNLVFTSTFLMTEPLAEVAARYPGVSFVLLDAVAKPAANVSSVLFDQHEGSFTAGALAAMVSKTKKTGFIGAMDLPVIKSFLVGFKEGVRYVDPDISVTEVFLTAYPDFSGFEDPRKGEAAAKKMYDRGIDIIYTVAGVTGNGVIEAARKTGKYAIGVDSNQDHLAPGHVLTSMMKNCDRAVLDIVQRFIKGSFAGNHVYRYGYKNGGVGITPMEFTRDKLPPGVMEKIKEVEKKIIGGEIAVTNILAPPPSKRSNHNE